MKRLSLIIALALVVTIGGVFAAWHYDRGAVSLEITRSATMASIQSDTPKGSITIDQSANNGNGNTLKFLIDDAGITDWVAELVPTGSVYVKFEPGDKADAAVKAEGIAMKATISLGGEQKPYKEKQIFSIKEGNNTVILNGGGKTLDSVPISATDIANCLVFNEGETVKLESYEENLNYETAMKSYIIVITISEITNP